MFVYVFGRGRFRSFRRSSRRCVLYGSSIRRLRRKYSCLMRRTELCTVAKGRCCVSLCFERTRVAGQERRTLGRLRRCFSNARAFASLGSTLGSSKSLVDVSCCSVQLVTSTGKVSRSSLRRRITAIGLASRSTLLDSRRGLGGTDSVLYSGACRTLLIRAGTGLTGYARDLLSCARGGRGHTRAVFFSDFHGLGVDAFLVIFLVLTFYFAVERLVMGPLVDCGRYVHLKRVFPMLKTMRLRGLTVACGRICQRGRRARRLVQRRTRCSTLASYFGHESFGGFLDLCRASTRGRPFTLVLVSVSMFGSIGSACKRTVNSIVLGGITSCLGTTFQGGSCIYQVNKSRFTVLVIRVAASLRCAVGGGVSSIGRRLSSPRGKVPGMSLDTKITFSSHRGPKRGVFRSTSGTLCGMGRGKGGNYKFC